ncbi:MAG: DnaB-like helicase C-terminal domain-containing protein, partial [Planktothrix sp.]
SNFIDDGIKPVFRVTTKLGRFVESTLTHPFLTIQGWRPLAELQSGDKIAVPRQFNSFGSEKLPEYQVKILGYLLGDGGLTNSNAVLTNNNYKIQQDFIESVQNFTGLKVRIDNSNGTRALSLNAVKDLKLVAHNRQIFAKTLKEIAEYQGMSRLKIAQSLGVSVSSVDAWINGKSVPKLELFEQLCHLLNVDRSVLAHDGIETIQKNSKNSLVIWLETIGLWGKNSHQKTIPEIIFKLERSQIALFLNRLFATDGWATILASGQCQLGYASVSEELARQVQHLLLRFGVIATLKKRSIKYKETRRTAWQLDITDALSIKTFISEIGIFSKEETLIKIETALMNKRYQTNRDLIPIEIWQEIVTVKGDESWQSLAKRAEIPGYSNIHVGKRQLSRERLWTLATALDHLPLQQLATSEIYWDEIVSIEFMGEKQVYDLTIPETHNFVANDICVHNTSFAVGLGHNIAKGQKLPIAVFSLEMSKGQLVQRLLSSEAKIESNRIRSGRISQSEWEPLTMAISSLAELPIFIDDTPNITVTEMRSKARRLQAENGGVLGLILIDYLQLMEGASDNRV